VDSREVQFYHASNVTISQVQVPRRACKCRAEESPDGFLDATQNRPERYSPQIDSICGSRRELHFYLHPACTQDRLRVLETFCRSSTNHQTLLKMVYHSNRKVEQVACKANRRAGPYHTFVSAFDVRHTLDALWYEESPRLLKTSFIVWFV
jgi:hypothetical protein